MLSDFRRKMHLIRQILAKGKFLCFFMLIAIILSACQVVNAWTNPWEKIANGENFWIKVNTSSIGDNVVVADNIAKYVQYRGNGNNAFSDRISVVPDDDPSGNLINSVCITSREIWVVTLLHQVLSYDLETKTWTQHIVDYSEAGNLRCYVTRKEDILIYGGKLDRINKIYIYHQGKWDAENLPDGNTVVDIVQDKGDNLWLGMLDGSIYKKTAGEWQFIDKLDMEILTTLFVASDGTLWVSSWNQLFSWRLEDRTDQPQLIAEFDPRGGDHKGYLVKVYDDNQGLLWVCARDSIWTLQTGNILKQMPFPSGQNFITSSAFNEETGKLYVSTGRDVYSLDTRVQR